MSVVSPLDIWEFWIGPARDDASAAADRVELWFKASAATDQAITERFGTTLDALQRGLAWDWARRSPRARLSAIIVLDQFSRNIHRGTPLAFANDRLARLLTLDALAQDEHRGLTEAEQIFLYLPLEHAEDLEDQDDSVRLFGVLAETARAEFIGLTKQCLDFAERHRDVIVRFGRFPHRNAILGRDSTDAERAYLAEPGSGF